MPDRDPKPNNPLSPYYPSEVPEIPGNGRRWLAILVALGFALWAITQLLELLGAVT